MLAPLYASADVRLAEPNLSVLSQGLVGYWSMNGNTINWNTGAVQDLSGNGNTGTLVGMSTTSSEVAGKIGGALNFNGSTSAVCAPNSSSLDITGPITISAWIYPTSFGGGNKARIFDKDTGSVGYSMLLDNVNKTDAFGFGVNTLAFSTKYAVSPSNVITLNKWQQVVATYDGNATVNFYVNGVQYAPSEGSVTSPASDSSTISGCIGESLDVATRSFAGNIGTVRVYNRALSPQEVQMLYETGTFNLGNTPALNSSFSIDQGGLNSGLVAYWPLDGNTTNWNTDTMKDISGNGYNATSTGMSTTSSPTAGKIGGALKFNGTSSYLSFSPITLSGAFTLTLWWYSYANDSTNRMAVGSNNGGTSQKFGKSSSNTFFVRAVSGGSSDTSVALPSAQAWHFITLARNASNIVTVSVDAGAPTTLFAGAAQSGNFVLSDLGYSDPGNGQYFNGILDDVRVYNRALSTQEILNLYNAGQVKIGHSNSTSGIGINSGLIGYWTFDGSTINWTSKTVADVSGQGNTLTMSGFSSPTAAAIPGKIGQALKFNDSEDLYHSNISAFSFGTGDFSVSFWMDPVSPWNTATTIGVIGQKTSDSYNGWQIYQDSGHPGYLDMRITQQNNFLTASTIPTGKWIYVTFTRQGGSLYWYLNGVLNATGTNAGNISDTASFYIGYAQTWTAYYSGALDDVRIYNRALSAQEVQQLYQMGR